MKRFLLFLFFTFPVTAACSAQSKYYNTPPSFPDSAQILRKNHIRFFIAAAGYAWATYLCYRFLDAGVMDESQEIKNKPGSFVSHSVRDLGLGRSQVIGFTGTTLVAVLSGNRKLQGTVAIWGASLLLNSTLTDQLKKTFQRHRPNSGDPYNRFDWRGGSRIHTSFPSAHTSNAFTTATVFAILYKEKKWLPPLAYGLAALVGLSRIYDNAHWASDVMAGAGIGFLSAKTSIYLYKKVREKITFLPSYSAQFKGATLVYNF